MNEYDPVTMDPIQVDIEHPPFVERVKIESGGDQMNVRLYVAQGAGPHPTVVLLHGYPGGTDLTYLAHVLQRAGYNVLYPHYRGTWGSGGSFSWSNALEDVQAVLAFLRSEEARKRYRFHPDRIALAGHSVGGWLALMSAAGEPGVGCAAGFMFGNLGHYGKQDIESEEKRAADAADLGACVGEVSGPVRGTSGEALVAEAMQHAPDYDLLSRARALSQRVLLLVSATQDASCPLAEHHEPLVRALREAGANRLTEVVLDTDHNFVTKKIAVARVLFGWLRDECRH